MNTSIRFKIAAFAFVGLLLLPTLDQLLNLSTTFKSTENRQQSTLPPLNFPHVRSFVRQFDQYYKENFGWRNALFYTYSRWKLNMLGQSPLPEKVVVGNDGWFYLGNSYNHVVDQHRGLVPLSADSARIIAQHLTDTQQRLAKQGIRFYVLIAPDSHTIYPEYLPTHLTVSSQPSRLDVLARAMRQTAVPFIDIRDTLIAAKKEHVVYYQTDTHWNDYGTLIGSMALLNRIRQDIPLLPAPRLTDYRIDKQRGLGGDLTTMLTVQKEYKDPVYYDIKPAPDRTARLIGEVPNPVSGFPSVRFAKTTTSSLPHLLFIGDSFSHSMMQFVPGYFQSAYFMRGRHIDPAVVATEKPDVLVVEIVERNINELATL